MKPHDFEKWYGKTFVRISKPKTDAELKFITSFVKRR